MIHPGLLFIACLPLIFRLVPFFVPDRYLESYAWWSADVLNRREGEVECKTAWRNMGWWEGTEDFVEANEALARKLIDFSRYGPGGSILDIAHGAGESLSLHLSTNPPPKYLHALTSLPFETLQAQNLIAARQPNTSTRVTYFTTSASYRPGKDLDHPLNPMKGFMGESKSQSTHGYDDDDDDEEGEEDLTMDVGDTDTTGPPPYDLIYILDAIYHFPPSVPYFLASILPSLSPETGIIAYTDILPPSNLSAVLIHLILPWLLKVPTRNLASRPKDLVEYKALLERVGYVDVVVEDWSQGVWKGFAGNLRSRGGVWKFVGNMVERAEKTGWKFIGVRARRPALLAGGEGEA